MIKCEFALDCAYRRGIAELLVGRIIILAEYDLVVKGLDGYAFQNHYKVSRKQDRLPECPVTGDSNTFPAPTPEPIFRIRRFKFVSPKVFPIGGCPSSILSSEKLKRSLINLGECYKSNIDNNSDDDTTEIRSQVFPTPKKDSAQNKPFLEFGEDISQAEFITQVRQDVLQNKMVSSPSLGGVPSSKTKIVHNRGLSQDTALLLPRSPMLCLHPGWEGMMGVTKLDVTVPKDQLAALEIESGSDILLSMYI